MKQIDGSNFEFSTGTLLYAHGGIIGITPDLIIYGGYDDHLDWYNDFTFEEKIELADYMVSVWEKYKKEAEETKEVEE